MALTLVLEDGSGLPNSNSYALWQEAYDYHLSRFDSEAWHGASVGTGQTALVWATRLIDQLVRWNGFPSNLGQALQWPRYGVYERNGGYLIDGDVIPTWLKHATAELARHLLGGDITAPDSTSGIKRSKIEGLEIEFDRLTRPGILPRSVVLFVNGYGTIIAGSPGIATVPVLRT